MPNATASTYLEKMQRELGLHVAGKAAASFDLYSSSAMISSIMSFICKKLNLLVLDREFSIAHFDLFMPRIVFL